MDHVEGAGYGARFNLWRGLTANLIGQRAVDLLWQCGQPTQEKLNWTLSIPCRAIASSNSPSVGREKVFAKIPICIFPDHRISAPEAKLFISLSVCSEICNTRFALT